MAAVPLPEPTELVDGTESEEAYGQRLRSWYDSVDEATGTNGSRGEWEYICSVVGIAPD
jgi:hypothetical protein